MGRVQAVQTVGTQRVHKWFKVFCVYQLWLWLGYYCFDIMPHILWNVWNACNYLIEWFVNYKSSHGWNK
jgi:hypothetical protein